MLPAVVWVRRRQRRSRRVSLYRTLSAERQRERRRGRRRARNSRTATTAASGELRAFIKFPLRCTGMRDQAWYMRSGDRIAVPASTRSRVVGSEPRGILRYSHRPQPYLDRARPPVISSVRKRAVMMASHESERRAGRLIGIAIRRFPATWGGGVGAAASAAKAGRPAAASRATSRCLRDRSPTGYWGVVVTRIGGFLSPW